MAAMLASFVDSMLNWLKRCAVPGRLFTCTPYLGI